MESICIGDLVFVSYDSLNVFGLVREVKNFAQVGVDFVGDSDFEFKIFPSNQIYKGHQLLELI